MKSTRTRWSDDGTQTTVRHWYAAGRLHTSETPDACSAGTYGWVDSRVW